MLNTPLSSIHDSTTIKLYKLRSSSLTYEKYTKTVNNATGTKISIVSETHRGGSWRFIGPVEGSNCYSYTVRRAIPRSRKYSLSAPALNMRNASTRAEANYKHGTHVFAQILAYLGGLIISKTLTRDMIIYQSGNGCDGLPRIILS